MKATSIVLAIAVISIVPTFGSQVPSTPVAPEVTGEILREGLPKLGEAYDVRLRSGPNAAPRRLFIYPNHRALSEFRTHLQQFVPQPPGKAKWYRDGPTLLFDEDSASRNARLNSALRHRQKLAQRRRAEWKEKQDWARPRPGEPSNLAMGRRRIADHVGIFAGLPPQAREAAFSGVPVRIPFTALSPAAQQIVYQHVRHRSSWTEGAEELRFIGSRDYARTVVEVFPTGTPDQPGLRMRVWTGPSGGLEMNDIINTPTWDPQNGWSWDKVYQDYRQRERGPKDRQKNPALQKRVSLTGGRDATIETVLRELTQRAELPLLGDYDPCCANPYRPQKSNQITLEAGTVVNVPVWKALDILCKQFDLDWSFQNGWIYLRSPRSILGWSGELDLSPPERKLEGETAQQ